MDDQLRVLIVDDDPMQLDMVSRRLRLEGFEVAVTASSFGASNLIRSFSPRVVLLDVNIPALAGDKLLALARRVAPRDTQFVLYSACDESQLRELARRSQADDWISKSVDLAVLADRLRKLCSGKRANQG
ncbi:MAG: Response regulator [bacterium]|nr:Response regulator [bacterium]